MNKIGSDQSKFKKCSLKKNAFKDKLVKLVELSGYTLKGCDWELFWEINLKY